MFLLIYDYFFLLNNTDLIIREFSDIYIYIYIYIYELFVSIKHDPPASLVNKEWIRFLEPQD